MHALALSLVSFVLGKCFLVEVHLHDLFLHFLPKCFFCKLFWGIYLGGDNKCVGVNERGGWCWNGMCFLRVV